MCFVWISEQTAILSLYSINWLVFITETGVCLLRGTDWNFIYNSEKYKFVKEKARFLLRSSVRSVSVFSCNNKSCSRFIVSQHKQHLRQRIKVLLAPDTVTCLSVCLLVLLLPQIFTTLSTSRINFLSREVFTERKLKMPRLCAPVPFTQRSVRRRYKVE